MQWLVLRLNTQLAFFFTIDAKNFFFRIIIFDSSYILAADCVDWSLVFPKHCDSNGKLEKAINFADIGCGFGGLLVKLGENFPEVLRLPRFLPPSQAAAREIPVSPSQPPSRAALVLSRLNPAGG